MKYLAQTLFIGAWLLFATDITLAQSAEMSLKQAQEYALQNSFTAKTTNYDAEAAEYSTKELIASGLPQINGSMQYNSYIHVPVMVIPAGGFFPGGGEMRVKMQQPENLTLGVSAQQLVFNGTWLVGLEASKSYELLQQKNIEKTQQQVKEEVAKAYYLALVSAENVRLLSESRSTLSNVLRDTEAMFSNGFAEKQDVDQLMLSVNDIDIQISYAEQQQRIVLDLLKMQMGYPLSNELILTETIEGVINDSDSQAILNTSFNVKNTVDYAVTQQALTMQKLNVKAKKAAYLPTLGAFLNFQTQAMREEFNFFDTSRPFFYGNLWGLQLNMPILSGGQRRHAVNKAEVEVRRYSDMLAFTEQAAELEYRSARTEFDNALRVYESSKRSLQLANDIYQATTIKYNEGIGASFDLTQRNTQVIQAKGAHIQAMLKMLQAKTRLQKAINQL